MQFSHSRIECFESCKFKYKMRYLEGLKTIPYSELPDNALFVGTAIHTGIEKDIETAIEQYFFSYPIITDEHIDETIKFETVIPLAKNALPAGGEFEVEISDADFHGFIDYLAPVYTEQKLNGENQPLPNVYDIYDFKYSNNVSHYQQSRQLHLYKYFFEKCNPGKTIRNLYFLFVPKATPKRKKTETISEFRARLQKELNNLYVKIVPVQFDYNKVIEFLLQIKAANEETEFAKTENYMCRYCEFEQFCKEGNDFMILPKNERRTTEVVKNRKIWIYGTPFSGKTTFANGFPDPLMLNTDGNIKFVDAPYIRIKDEVKVEGRQTKRTFAWEIFKDVIAELEKKENTFKTIVVDLLEDLYEYCRLYMYKEMGISHESDDSFRAWDKVRSEFLNTLKRLMNLDYENIILISHEDTSKDITKKGGDKVTAIKPNFQEKVANKVAGLVDVVARIVADGDSRIFSFKSNEVIFGGGRLKVTAKDIPLDVNALFAVYDEANNKTAVLPAEKPAESARRKTTTKSRTDSTADSVVTEKPIKDTIEETPPAESAGEALENGEPSAETWTPGGGDVDDSVPITESTDSELPFTPDTEKTEEEKPRRRRKARE